MTTHARARKARNDEAANAVSGETAGTQPARSAPADVPLTPAEAAQELRHSLGRVWHAARDNVRDIGQAWRSSARHMGEEARHAADETRGSLGAAVSGMGEVREDLMRDTRELSRSVGSNLGRYVRAHPVRSLALAAVTGAILVQALRLRRSD